MPGRYQDRHKEAFAGAVSGEARLAGQVLNVEGKRKDGSEFAAALTVSAPKHNKSGQFAGVIRDVSEQQRSQQAFEARTREVEGLNHLAQLQIKEQDAVFAKLGQLVSQLAESSIAIDKLAENAASDQATSASVHIAHVIHQLDELIASAARSNS
jgi:hypothetical protein